jgi:hypothetical protein
MFKYLVRIDRVGCAHVDDRKSRDAAVARSAERRRVENRDPVEHGDAVAERIEREVAWIERFDVRVWTYQLLVAKPDPRTYTRTLDLLGIEPGQALFLDDRLVNIEAARTLGIQGLVFSTVEKLRADLLAGGFDAELPLLV